MGWSKPGRMMEPGRASGLTLLTAAIALWNAVYLEQVVAALRARGEEVPEEYLRHLSPLEWEHITLTGVYRWDLGDPQTVDADSFRALRRLTLPSSISRAVSTRPILPS